MHKWHLPLLCFLFQNQEWSPCALTAHLLAVEAAQPQGQREAHQLILAVPCPKVQTMSLRTRWVIAII